MGVEPAYRWGLRGGGPLRPGEIRRTEVHRRNFNRQAFISGISLQYMAVRWVVILVVSLLS